MNVLKRYPELRLILGSLVALAIMLPALWRNDRRRARAGEAASVDSGVVFITSGVSTTSMICSLSAPSSSVFYGSDHRLLVTIHQDGSLAWGIDPGDVAAVESEAQAWDHDYYCRPYAGVLRALARLERAAWKGEK